MSEKKTKMSYGSVYVWKASETAYKIKIDDLGVILSVSKKASPKTYDKINKWIDEPPTFIVDDSQP